MRTHQLNCDSDVCWFLFLYFFCFFDQQENLIIITLFQPAAEECNRCGYKKIFCICISGGKYTFCICVLYYTLDFIGFFFLLLLQHILHYSYYNEMHELEHIPLRFSGEKSIFFLEKLDEICAMGLDGCWDVVGVFFAVKM